jgi:hypothetical protein
MSETEDTTSPAPLATFSLDRDATISTMRFLFNGNPDLAADVLRQCHRFTPEVAVSVLASLGSGSKTEHDIAVHLLHLIFAKDPLVANTLFLSLLNGQSLSTSNASPGSVLGESATEGM